MEDWYRLPEEEVLSRLNSDRRGLTEEEAIRRVDQYGMNVLRESRKKTWFRVFLEQFQDLLVQILVGAALISMVSGNSESTIVIFAVLLLNAVLGTVQHQKAQKSLESLKALSAPAATVIRNGKKKKIAAAQIVPGDLLVLESGDLVAADGRLLETNSLRINESSLTGEADSVEKTRKQMKKEMPLADRTNMVFSGGLVTGGRGIAAVTATGMNTEMGRIAELMNSTKEQKTPLQISLDRFSGRLAAAIMAISIGVFFLSLYRGSRILDALMFAVALAVAAIPEALGTIVTIVQAMGTQRMAKQNAIIKDLKAVESLGCVSVICTDKTGTLTQNRMTVQAVYDGERFRDFEEKGKKYSFQKRDEAVSLIEAAVLANNAESGEEESGDPVETALLRMASEAGVDIKKIRSQWKRLKEQPFQSAAKQMSVECENCQGERFWIVKGAVDVLLNRCSRFSCAQGLCEMTALRKKQILRQNESWGRAGYRVLAFACTGRNQPFSTEKSGGAGLIFVGLAAFMDPPRPESAAAVKKAMEAGIKPVMITGDHPVTALSIAEKIHLIQPWETVMTGRELDGMEEEELERRLPDIAVYARVSPEHKIRIVKAWQRRGRIVAMTGDGVNDAPALKKADIGVAMGVSGTEVSRDAASMILADDNFATIIAAVENGRNVYRNIQNAIDFLISGNMAGIFCVLYTSLLALPMPFAPVHLLFINLVTDSLPALAIGMEPAEEGLLRQKPRDPSKGILTKTFMKDILIQGGLIAVGTMAAYYIGLSGLYGRTAGNPAVASTMAFTTLTLARLFHGFNCRSHHSILHLGLFSNLYSIMAFEAGVVLLAAVLFVPWLQRLFAASDLSVMQVAAIGICAVVPTLIIQAWKLARESFRSI